MDALFDIGGVGVGELEQGFVASASEIEHGLLAVDFHLAGIFEGFIEGATKSMGRCSSGDDEVACVVGTREHLVSRWWSAFGHGWGLEEVGVFAICPGCVSQGTQEADV